MNMICVGPGIMASSIRDCAAMSLLSDLEICTLVLVLNYNKLLWKTAALGLLPYPDSLCTFQLLASKGCCGKADVWKIFHLEYERC